MSTQNTNPPLGAARIEMDGKSVDVLAVMIDAGNSLAIRCGDEAAAPLRAARAAAAELIEANAAEYAAWEAYSNAPTGAPRNDMWAGVQAAQARRLVALIACGYVKATP